MKIELFFEKVRRKLWGKVVKYSRNKRFYPFIYRSYWHFLFNGNKMEANNSCYYTAQPNKGAGIGHQMANWIAGYWFARQFELKFAHIPFSSEKWEVFLGFGIDEISVATLLTKGYSKVRLPMFDEFNEAELALQKKIIVSYGNNKVIFVAEQDQFYKDQFGNISEIKNKFYKNETRKNEILKYSKEYHNIAIHVRRGDIVIGQVNQDPGLLMRWQDNDYFVKVLRQVLAQTNNDKPIAIYLFSQGTKKDFPEFDEFPNINYCLDWSAEESFLHLVYADVLITSKSSFSYKPALISNGLKVVPNGFWHGYPQNDTWLVASNDGILNKN